MTLVPNRRRMTASDAATIDEGQRTIEIALDPNDRSRYGEHAATRGGSR
jgi:hypothetical protein